MNAWVRRRWFGCFRAALGGALACTAQAQIEILHEFDWGAEDGAKPYGSPIVIGDTVYGMTREGGTNERGVVFSVGVDGTGYTNLHEFSGSPSEGAFPQGSLITDGNTFYGMTRSGGAGNRGVVFAMRLDGSGYTNLHHFSYESWNGESPWGSLLLHSNTLYGMTESGGNEGGGIAFSIRTDGSAFYILRNFDAWPNNGYSPKGDVILGTDPLHGHVLYGMTTHGGVNITYDEPGVVFMMTLSGDGYVHLHDFTDTASGGYPWGSLIRSGDLLYGMAKGGQHDQGVVFRLTTSGTGYTNLHHFAGAGQDEGADPTGSLVLGGGRLYGMTGSGGEGHGVVFSIGLDGTGYTNLHRFAGQPQRDGSGPSGSLALHDKVLYGMTRAGGLRDLGVVFRLPLASAQPDTPDLLSIGILSEQAHLSWREVPAATAYEVHTAAGLGAGFAKDTSGVFSTQTNWVGPISPTQRAWCVKALLP